MDRKTSGSLTFTQRQVACLLCNAFFCLFPGRARSGERLLVTINFDTLFRKP